MTYNPPPQDRPEQEELIPLVPGQAPPPQPGEPRQVMIPIILPDVPPLATRVLLAILVAIFAAGMFVPASIVTDNRFVETAHQWFIYRGGNNTSLIIEGGEYYRLLTAMFLHGDIMHILFNGYALYVLGTFVERMYGHVRFLVVYFLAGLAGSVLSMIATQDITSVGASGALFGLFAAEIVMLYRHRKEFGSFATRNLRSLVFLLAFNVLIGLSPGSNIDNFGHFGGFIGGLIVAWFICPRYSVILPTLQKRAVEFKVEPDTNTAVWWLVPAMFAALLVVITVGFSMMYTA